MPVTGVTYAIHPPLHLAPVVPGTVQPTLDRNHDGKSANRSARNPQAELQGFHERRLHDLRSRAFLLYGFLAPRRPDADHAAGQLGHGSHRCPGRARVSARVSHGPKCGRRGPDDSPGNRAARRRPHPNDRRDRGSDLRCHRCSGAATGSAQPGVECDAGSQTGRHQELPDQATLLSGHAALDRLSAPGLAGDQRRPFGCWGQALRLPSVRSLGSQCFKY